MLNGRSTHLDASQKLILGSGPSTAEPVQLSSVGSHFQESGNKATSGDYWSQRIFFGPAVGGFWAKSDTRQRHLITRVVSMDPLTSKRSQSTQEVYLPGCSSGRCYRFRSNGTLLDIAQSTAVGRFSEPKGAQLAVSLRWFHRELDCTLIDESQQQSLILGILISLCR